MLTWGKEHRETRKGRRLSLDLEKNVAIPELRELIADTECGERVVVFRNRDGQGARTTGLKKDHRVAVAESVVPEGMEFDQHTHPGEVEWIIVYEGTLVYREAHIEKRMGPGDGVAVFPGVAHSVEAVGGDALVIAITIPPSEAFPCGP